jgi:hypothetical protein
MKNQNEIAVALNESPNERERRPAKGFAEMTQPDYEANQKAYEAANAGLMMMLPRTYGGAN